MLALLLDENFNGRIWRGLLRQRPGMDLLRVQDTELGGAEDPALLEWASMHHRVLVTHDINTMPGFAYEKMERGGRMTGLIVVPEDMPIGQAIDELILLTECSTLEEFEGMVEYLPL